MIISFELPTNRNSFYNLLAVTMSGYFLSVTHFCHKLKSMTIPFAVAYEPERL